MKTKENITAFTGWDPVGSKGSVRCLACGKYGHQYNQCPNEVAIAEKYCSIFGTEYDPIDYESETEDWEIELAEKEAKYDRILDLERDK